MKILGPNNEELAQVTLLLTPAEARELSGAAEDLVDHPEKHHQHVSSHDYQTEITVSVYTPENLDEFDADLRRLLREDLDADQGRVL